MRRATIRTELADADVVAASLVPDNTPEIETSVEDGTVVTHIERETTGGLQSTVDDYVVNLSVAAQTVQTANHYRNTNHE
ncbi:KEOPS complex subunit Pcc1 [Haladaptatus sp. NG-WS-4]